MQGHELSVRISPESLLLDADPVRLAQVVGNLLTNAAKYTEPNGRIWMTAERDGKMAVLRPLPGLPRNRWTSWSARAAKPCITSRHAVKRHLHTSHGKGCS